MKKFLVGSVKAAACEHCTLEVIQVDEIYRNVVVRGAKENLHSLMKSALWVERFIW